MPDGMEVLTPEKFASIKSRLDGRKIRTMQQLAGFHKLVAELEHVEQDDQAEDEGSHRGKACQQSSASE